MCSLEKGEIEASFPFYRGNFYGWFQFLAVLLLLCLTTRLIFQLENALHSANVLTTDYQNDILVMEPESLVMHTNKIKRRI